MSNGSPRLVHLRRTADGRESFVSEDRAEILRLKEKDGFKEVRTRERQDTRMSDHETEQSERIRREGKRIRAGF